MIEVCLLGAGGTMPLPGRWLTSLLVRWNGTQLLVDCGEGTQIALREKGFSCHQIDSIFLTHYHADHTAGLPGLLLTMAKSERLAPVSLYGPKGLQELMQGVLAIARYLPFELRCIEYAQRENTFEIKGMKITAFGVKHSVPCFGYCFDYPRAPRFDAAKAKKLGLPVNLWGILQKGNAVEYEGRQYLPEEVMGEKRRGIKFVYATDTRPVPFIGEYACNGDLLIAEGMYGDKEKQANALENRHMMMQEAAAIAAGANVRKLWLTHYSPSMPNPGAYEQEVKEIFENTLISNDGAFCDLSFSEE